MEDKMREEIRQAERDGYWGKEYYGHNYWAAEANRRARGADLYNSDTINTGPSEPVHPQKRLANFILAIGMCCIIPSFVYGIPQHILSFSTGVILVIWSVYTKIAKRRLFAAYDPNTPSTFMTKDQMKRKHPNSKMGMSYQEVEDLYKD